MAHTLSMMLRERLLAHLREPAYTPADESELCRRLGLNKKQGFSLAHEIRQFLSEGIVVRGAGGRLQVRGAEGEILGRIQFRAGGSAFVTPDAPVTSSAKLPAIQIPAEETDIALPGDRVAVRVLAGVQGRR